MGKEALAFNHEFYKKEINRNQVRDDIVSYLGEYRFQIPEFSYQLGFLNGEIIDPNTFESMSSKAKKAITFKTKRGIEAKREKAEYEGFKKIEKELLENPFGIIVWFSPPGPKEEGYGDYGFVYTGRRSKDGINMKALRLENPKLEDFNRAKKAVANEDKEYENAEDFLRSPWVLICSEKDAIGGIKNLFELPNSKRGEVFKEVITEMSNIIEEFLDVVRNGSDIDKLKARFALENYALECKKRAEQPKDDIYYLNHKTLESILPSYSHQPPKVAGSCGSSSSNFISQLKSSGLFSESEGFVCPKCGHHADGPIGDQCPGCGITKEEFAAEGGEVCE
ncbi:MAG: hypothetical protein A2152_00910 [Candidatus Levybacteria bacterium RBG_16_35_6]|nr:MAG: hypothetical protein A2152_00910 [Candidatus Levybacteria bacterium RBG_16_35_6]